MVFTPPGALFLLSEEVYHVCRAHECEFESLGLGLVAGRAPEPLRGARGRSGVSLSFFMRPSCIFFVQKERLFAEPSSASLGRWVSARLQEEPPSLCTEREGDQEFPWLFMRPSCILFVRKEKWNMSGYPRWARAVTFLVSCYWVVRVEARAPFAKGQLAV